MIEFYVSGQSLKVFSPALAADSLNYLRAKVNFTGSDWDGASKWLHFRSGDRVYDIQLDEDDCISADKHLNLSCGLWEIYLTGTRGDSRLTTLPVMLRVYASGLIDAPLHEVPLSVAEQVDFNARQALLLAQAVKDMADSGAFDGSDGKGFYIAGYYDSAETLAAAVSQPQPGALYGVGTAAPYDMYVWDEVQLRWVNNGSIQGAPGETGAPGAKGISFIPHVDANGNLSWSNDGGLENPAVVNIMGPKGATGARGADGKSPYQAASEAGYTGTEATFYQALTAMPYHNARHLPDGADPIKVQSGNIENGAVTRAKLAQDALYSPMKYISSAAHTFAVEDIGKTYMESSSIATTADVVYTVDDTFGQGAPNGAEIAIIWRKAASVKISFAENQGSMMLGDSGATKNRTYAITDQFGMVAMKKINYGSTCWWLVTGNVEVVS